MNEQSSAVKRPSRFAAIEAGGTKWRVSVGEPPHDVRSVTIATQDPASTLGEVEAFIEAELRVRGPIDALGIGSFGPVGVMPNQDGYGVIGRTPKEAWQGVNLVSYFAKLGVPVAVDTDVNVAARGEFTAWGSPSGRLVYVTVGTGIGAGVADSGSTSLGMDHAEMGHITVRPHAEDSFEGVCPYHRHCLEGLASGPAIAARWGANLSELNEDHRAHRIVAYYLGQLSATLLLTLAPHQLIMGGGVLETPGLLALIRRSTHELLNGYLARFDQLEALDEVIRAPRLGAQAGITGAFSLARQAATASGSLSR